MATGILLFLLYDVIHGAIEPVDAALKARSTAAAGRASPGTPRSSPSASPPA